MATITEAIEKVSKRILNILERIDILEQKELHSLDAVELIFMRDQIGSKISLFLVVMDNRVNYDQKFVMEELKITTGFCKSSNERLLVLEKKYKD